MRISGRITCFIFFLLLPFLSHAVNPERVEQFRDSIRVLLDKENPSPSDIARMNELVFTCWNKYPGAKNLLNDALLVLEKSKQAGYDTLSADARINLVKMYLARYESTKSLQYSLEAYKIYEAAGNHEKMAFTLMNMGLVYYTQNNFNKSLEYYNSSVNEYEKSGNKKYLATLFYLSGINYSKLKNYSSAQMFFNRALLLKTELNDEQGIAECNVGIAELFIYQNQADSAIVYLNKASQYTDSTNNIFGESKIKILMSEALFQKSDYAEAKKQALDGVQLAEQTEAIDLIIEAKKNLYRLSQKTGDYKSAFYFLQEYQALRDSIINDKTSKNISRLEADYVLNKKQNEILLLENENRNRTLMLRGSVIIGILAIALAFLFYNKQQIRLKANRELEVAYNELETTKNQLVHQEKLASLGQLTAGIAHEIKNPLNFVNNFSNVSVELVNELNGAASEEERQEIVEDLKLNLERIATHGERANSIITRMLDHSRSGDRDMQPTDLNKLIQEYYNLAYQAARINIHGFNCTVNMYLDHGIPPVNVVTQEISRVLLNLFNNSLYALSQVKDRENFQPEVTVTSQFENGKVKVIISDNGPGIPQKILDKIFQPFFTTKPAGEGTGLGLSLSHDIIVAHGGTITARNKSEENNNLTGAEFTIVLPA